MASFIYKCRNCGKKHTPLGGMNSLVKAVFYGLLSGTSPETFGQKVEVGEVPEMITLHKCSELEEGVSDLIGVKYDK